MAEIRLELSLDRPSGALAGIVAALAQIGLALKQQKVERNDRDRGGRLFVRVEGEPPDPVVLAERLAGAPGVDAVVRIELDGEALWVDGQPVFPSDGESVDEPVYDSLTDSAAGPTATGDADAVKDATAETVSKPIAEPIGDSLAFDDDAAAPSSAARTREPAPGAGPESEDDGVSEQPGAERGLDMDEADPWLDPLASDDPEIDAWLAPDGRAHETEPRPAPLNADDMPLLLEMEQAAGEQATPGASKAGDRPGSDARSRTAAPGSTGDEPQRLPRSAAEPGGRTAAAPARRKDQPTPQRAPHSETAAPGLDEALATAVGDTPRRGHSSLRRRRRKRR